MAIDLLGGALDREPDSDRAPLALPSPGKHADAAAEPAGDAVGPQLTAAARAVRSLRSQALPEARAAVDAGDFDAARHAFAMVDALFAAIEAGCAGARRAAERTGSIERLPEIDGLEQQRAELAAEYQPLRDQAPAPRPQGVRYQDALWDQAMTGAPLPADLAVSERAARRDWHQRMAVQRRAAGAPAVAGDQVHAIAHAGVAGARAPLPHLDVIQASFGRHDVSHVRAEVGGDAVAASGAIGARAYAVGDRTGFAAAPDLHTAAHEAAHVVQQRAGVSLLGGVGAAGDWYERHADRVADAVVAGRSAEALLDEAAPGPAHAAGGAAV
ncbi:MAG TPA: DUF4157 domain-containing protein, partial [Kofleriaceae bacterium]|nr:DUF4157 domain-containing protein [Kofleriaceae bacterium]